ncbi:hypothetical protein [Halorubrum sp. Ib24]|uniref:hypothetical protein n=1 Tax=Halorubrum sp. Ib24 TaxID=1383850 RepID=UPI00117BA85F|nr:hypothetical protein [Halorubrum sp. Ib24]
MKERTFPAAYRRQYPGIARVFDENAAQSESAFTAYLHGGTDRRVLTTLVEELFRVLEYTVIPVESWHDAFDTVIRKGTSEYPIHTIRAGKPSRTALHQLTAAHTESSVPHSILVSAVTPLSERTKRVTEHSGVRVIDQSELRELVQAAISRLSEPVQASGTATRRTSTDPAKVERLIAKLEAACDEAETLVEQQAFAEATDRRDTVHDALTKVQTLIPAESGDQQFRERLTAVETRLADITSALQAAYTDRIAEGDSCVETATTAVADGDVTAGLRACQDARAAYADAQAIADRSKLKFRGDTEETPQDRVETVRRLEQQLHVRNEIQEAEATIESLAATVANTDGASHDPQCESELQAAAQAGFEQLDALPDNITDPALQARVSALETRVEQFETAAQQPRSANGTAPPDVGTAEGSRETTAVIRDTKEIIDRARQPAPVVLRLREELTEDGRRTVYRAETITGNSVQFDVWHRHSDQDTWEFNEWYLLENIRGQQWTVANGAGVTLSTTPAFTATKHESTAHETYTI